MPAQLFLGTPTVLGRLLRRVQQAASSDAGVLISGESGVGKELVARAIHHYSSRSTKPWMEVSCALLPRFQPGLLALAAGGTLFLNEIDRLELPLLLRGADVRVLAASRFPRPYLRNILKIHIRVPALRQRREDIGPLAELFLRQSNPAAGLAPDARRALQSYDWPGNVRELRRVITAAALVNPGRAIHAKDLWAPGAAA
jgi:DNA-binding NtrC family response regulator